MAACPKCGRALSPNAKQCVYCGAGNSFKPRQEIKVPAGTLPKRRRAIPWKTILLVLAVLGGFAVYNSNPQVKSKVDGWIHYIKSQF